MQFGVRNEQYTPHEFGFQGQEEDGEMWGGAVAFKYRVEDARLGRFFSVDPLVIDYPWNSPYAFSENKVIAFIELEGLESVAFNKTIVDFEGVSLVGVQSALKTHERSHRGHLDVHQIKSIPRGEVWSASSYTADGIPAGTIITKFKTMQDYNSGKAYSTETKRDVMQSVGGFLDWAFGAGSNDGANSGGELAGEEGLVKYSDGLDWVGRGLESSRVLAPVGIILTVASDVIDTSLDYKNLDSKTATKKLATRVAYAGLDKLTEKLNVNATSKVQDGLSNMMLKTMQKVSEDDALNEIEK